MTENNPANVAATAKILVSLLQQLSTLSENIEYLMPPLHKQNDYFQLTDT